MIKRPALRYYGGKWRLAPWIISYFPTHLNYVEPCGGAASVLLQKPKAPLETYNDLSGDVVNFFRVLRDHRDTLLDKIYLTPWAREEYNDCLRPTDDPIEAARRFYAVGCMGFNGATVATKGKYGWRNITDHKKRQTPSADIQNNNLWQIADRLATVQIENMDWIDVVNRFDNADALIYMDPPYVQEERTKGHYYSHEWTNEQHEEAAGILNQCRGYVVLSGYNCPLYADIYADWIRVDRSTNTNSGGTRIESLWLSPRTWATLQANTLFGGTDEIA